MDVKVEAGVRTTGPCSAAAAGCLRHDDVRQSDTGRITIPLGRCVQRVFVRLANEQGYLTQRQKSKKKNSNLQGPN
jgi:hypothetical protein